MVLVAVWWCCLWCCGVVCGVVVVWWCCLWRCGGVCGVVVLFVVKRGSVNIDGTFFFLIILSLLLYE